MVRFLVLQLRGEILSKWRLEEHDASNKQGAVDDYRARGTLQNSSYTRQNGRFLLLDHFWRAVKTWVSLGCDYSARSL